jgi:putative cell wall-binding protein
MSRRPLTLGGLIATIAVAVLASQPAVAAPLPISSPPPSVPVLHMGTYDPSRYTARAAELEPALVTALTRDLHMTGAQYLAQSDAALRATQVVSSLRKAGVTVRGFHLDGTSLVVNVASSSDVALVSKAGAIGDLSQPQPLVINQPKRLTSNIDVHGGQGYWWEDASYDYVCSVGFNGFLESDGSSQFATAGHCLTGTDAMVGRINSVTQTAPNSGILSNTIIGDPVASSIEFGSGYDVSRVALTTGTTPQPDVVTWGGGSGAPLANSPRTVTGEMPGVLGANICRSGATTGWRCGPIVDVDYTADGFDGEPGLTINSIVAQLCTQPGDSGGAGVVGTSAVGITSWSTAGDTCSTDPDNPDYSGLFPMSSSSPSVDTLYGGTWEMQAAVPTPVVTNPASMNPNTITGTLASATNANSVAVYLDGSSTAFATAPVTLSGGSTTGTWSLDISGAPDGLHTFTVVASYGTWSHSTPVAGSFARNVTVNRLSGADRYATGLLVAAAGFTAPVPVLYLTTGQNYPDALSAGPAAAHLGGPLLLVQPTSVSQDVLDAITAFDPARIIVLGAENSVSAEAFAQIQAAVPSVTIERMAGASRFETSRLITRDAFLDSDNDALGADVAYISNGNNFPDALSAGGAAASVHAPVILVNGQASSVPTETIQLLSDLGVTKIVVTGAENSVSAAIFGQLSALSGVTVVRQTGSDRYGTSTAVNNAAFNPTQLDVLLATGQNYPDALAGSSLAGHLGEPLYITTQACIQPTIFAELVRLKATEVTLLGGTPSLSADVAALKQC